MPAEKQSRLEAILLEMGSVAVAFSGGVDSTYLLWAAHRVLHEKCVAMTAVSPSYTQEEQARAKDLAIQLGVRHILLETHEMDNPDYVKNAPDRCYFSERELFDTMAPVVAAEGLSWVAYGAITDDLGDFRPGQRAAQEAGVRAPLIEAGLSKVEIRELSAAAGLPTHDLPSAACLSSRFAYGQPIVEGKLRGIEAGEAMLRGAGLRNVRIRHHGSTARIEVDVEALPALATGDLRERIVAHLKTMGYVYVTLDLQGFRSGSMNEALRPQWIESASRRCWTPWRSGQTAVDEALTAFQALPFENLEFARLDSHRALRTGFPEVVLCRGKTPAQVVHILERLAASATRVLATRAAPEVYAAVQETLPAAVYHPASGLITIGDEPAPQGIGTVLVLTAGTSDIPVAEEAALTARWIGIRVATLFDVGVAGIHRLFHHREQIAAANVLVVVAGMEGALPSVVAGLVDRPVIAVPTSIGYGAHFGGLAPLLTMLNSCAAGIAVVNIDNGFGAGCLAARINAPR